MIGTYIAGAFLVLAILGILEGMRIGAEMKADRAAVHALRIIATASVSIASKLVITI